MIQNQTLLNVADNTGAKILQCVQILSGTRHRYAQIGDVIVGTVKKAEPRKIVKKHDVVRAVVIRQKKEYSRSDGIYVRFDDNACVILDKDAKEARGTRIFGPIAREVRRAGFFKIASLAPEVL